MVEIKYDICSEVWYFNTAECRAESGMVKGVQVVPTGISADEAGRKKLDGYVVLYSLESGMVVTGNEVFASKEELIEHYRAFFSKR